MQPNQPNSWWGKGEPELRSLYEWIDLQSHGQTMGDKRMRSGTWCSGRRARLGTTV